MRKKLPKRNFRPKLRLKLKLGEKKVLGLCLLFVLLMGILVGRKVRGKYKDWEGGRYYRRAEETFEVGERNLNDVFEIYGQHADLGDEDLGAILAVIEEGILTIDQFELKKGEADEVLKKDLEASERVLAELKLLVEYLMRIQPYYKRLEASISDFLGKDFETTAEARAYLEGKTRTAERDFEACKEIEGDGFQLANEKFLVILKDYIDLLKSAQNAARIKSRFLYERKTEEYKERLEKSMNEFNETIELENLGGLEKAREEKERWDEEAIEIFRNEGEIGKDEK
jgi:hypothetical protein